MDGLAQPFPIHSPEVKAFWEAERSGRSTAHPRTRPAPFLGPKPPPSPGDWGTAS